MLWIVLALCLCRDCHWHRDGRLFLAQTALEEVVEREMIWLHAWNVGSGSVGLLPKER